MPNAHVLLCRENSTIKTSSTSRSWQGYKGNSDVHVQNIPMCKSQHVRQASSLSITDLSNHADLNDVSRCECINPDYVAAGDHQVIDNTDDTDNQPCVKNNIKPYAIFTALKDDPALTDNPAYGGKNSHPLLSDNPAYVPLKHGPLPKATPCTSVCANSPTDQN